MLHPYLLGSQSVCPPLSKLPGASVGKLELGASSLREPLGLFIPYRSITLSVPYERFPSFFYYCLSYFVTRGNLFSSAFPLCSRRIVPSPGWLMCLQVTQVTCLSGIQCCCRKSCMPLCVFSLLLLFPVVEQFKDNIYQLRRVHCRRTS